MGEFSISHWLVILVILLLFFGPSKLPGLGKSLGEAIRGFKKGLDDSNNPAQPPSQQSQDQLHPPSQDNSQSTVNSQQTQSEKKQS